MLMMSSTSTESSYDELLRNTFNIDQKLKNVPLTKYSLLAQNVHKCGLCPQLRPQWYRPADWPVPSETASKLQIEGITSPTYQKQDKTNKRKYKNGSKKPISRPKRLGRNCGQSPHWCTFWANRLYTPSQKDRRIARFLVLQLHHGGGTYLILSLKGSTSRNPRLGAEAWVVKWRGNPTKMGYDTHSCSAPQITPVQSFGEKVF
ncbi:hypothetical protein Y032_0281g1236 [Ancylostoma ceylanicum]|uniref:Uncharacterized protein n=1 Tax=Ancylostoma ceylanicum TaxID=53326 RepID=A0A016S7G3_9BILA|nr:hypothetical protein Y032_0281g1236 [Ancylostoma ceylanicum]